MKQITAGKNEAGQRIDKLLSKLCFGAPKSLIYKWLRKKRVKVNGKKCDGAYFVCEGDVLELYINDEFFEEKKAVPSYLSHGGELKVVYEDENILIVDKPSGLTAHSPLNSSEDCLLHRIHAYLYKKGEYIPENETVFSPALCNRIDRNTSGLVIAAKNARALRDMNEKIRDREVHKLYLLKTEKPVEPRSGIIEGYTVKNEAERKVYFSEKETKGSKRAVTKYRVIDGNMVEAELLTGRTHQIRASFSYIGFPLEGDVKYGAAPNGRKTYQELRAYKIIFDFKSEEGSLGYLNTKVIEA